MAWTAPADPENEARDRVRLAIGDIDTDDQIVQDADIDALLATEADEKKVYYLAATRAAARYAREVNTAVGPLKEEARVKWEHFMGLASALYREWQGLPPDAGTPSPFTWGAAAVGIRSKQSRYPTPFFTRDYPPGGRRERDL